MTVGLLVAITAGLAIATPAGAGTQLFSGSWSVKVLGNERTGGTGESAFYSALAIPGFQCNPFQPICPFSSTPTDGEGNFNPFGGYSYHCAPWYDFGGMGTTQRPAKDMTARTPRLRPLPPLYRNPVFFTPNGAPRRTRCTATSTGYTLGGKGRAQIGVPITGPIVVSNAAGTTHGGIDFRAAEIGSQLGIRTTGFAGERPGSRIYHYTYTYATLRNGAGFFAPGEGPGSFELRFEEGAKPVARIRVKQGAAKFGGTMRMLGALTSKIGYNAGNGPEVGTVDALYDAIGATAPTQYGVVTQGFQTGGSVMFFNSRLLFYTTVTIEGSRFPWTTGSVTVTAVGRRSHETVHYAHGYDNRGPVQRVGSNSWQSGTLQLVSPVLTRWMRPGSSYQTAGIAILRFVPEPHGWLMLAAGASLLGIGYRMRAREARRVMSGSSSRCRQASLRGLRSAARAGP